MPTWIWIIVICVIVLAALTAVARRRLRGTVDPTYLTLDPALMSSVQTLARSGQELQAIAALRAGVPGLGLASARLMVGRMMPAAAAGVSGEVQAAIPPELVDHLRRLVDERGRIFAIKALRTEMPGMGLREAKDTVDRLAPER